MIDLAQRLRELPTKLVDQTAPEIARAIEAEIKRQVSQGVDPYGRPWPLTRDGDRALRDAADAIRVTVLRDRVVVTLTGVEALHDRGAVRGGVRRQILPDRAEIPPRLAAVIEAAIARVWRSV